MLLVVEPCSSSPAQKLHCVALEDSSTYSNVSV